MSIGWPAQPEYDYHKILDNLIFFIDYGVLKKYWHDNVVPELYSQQKKKRSIQLHKINDVGINMS